MLYAKWLGPTPFRSSPSRHHRHAFCDGLSTKSDPVLLKPRNYIFVLKITINITILAFCWAIEIVA
jgi:hypothetical protein